MTLAEKIKGEISPREFYSRYFSFNGSKTEIKVKCCFHKDRIPSLAINLDNGLFHCFGCERGGDIIDFYKERNSLDFKSAVNKLAKEYNINLDNKDEIYTYLDENDKELFQYVRLNGDKNKNYYRRKVNGNWVNNIKGVRRVLYNLPEVIKSKIVIIVEGEKDVETLRKYKMPATTNPFGAGRWRSEYKEYLKDKKVIVIPDNDKEGEKHVEAIIKDIKSVVSAIKYLKLPNLKHKQDVTDYLRTHSIKELKEEIKKSEIIYRNEKPLALPDFLRKSIPTIQFYITDIIQKQGKTIVSADNNIGKTLFVQDLALHLTSPVKNKFIDKFKVEKANVLFLDFEMGESSLKQRFSKMLSEDNNPPQKLYIKYLSEFDILNKSNQEKLENWIKDLNIQIIIFDPIINATLIDENKKEEVQKLTLYLNSLIDRYKLSVVLVKHWKKPSKTQKSGGSMMAGSYLFGAWADIHIYLEGRNNENITIKQDKNRNGVKFKPFISKIVPKDLSFKFVSGYEKKYTDDTLIEVFDSFEKKRVSVPDIIKRAKEMNKGSENTIRKLIRESKVFKVDKSSKTYYLEKNDKTN